MLSIVTDLCKHHILLSQELATLLESWYNMQKGKHYAICYSSHQEAYLSHLVCYPDLGLLFVALVSEMKP
jgi:hypothetical protein